MSLRTISVLGALSVLVGIVQIAGCATTDDTTIVVAPDADPVIPVIDSGKQPVKDASTDAKPPVKDTGTQDVFVPPPTDAATDAAPKDAAPDTGPTAPATGTPCTVVGTNYTQSCGLCGTKEALCEVDLKVGAYSPCAGEVVGGCMPGMTTTKSCGICGTQTEICDNMCTPSTGACSGELAGGCLPGSVKVTVAGCGVGETRSQTCGATCLLGAPTACAAPVYPILTISRTVGTTVNADFDLSPLTDQLPRLSTGMCPNTITTTNTSYSWVKLVNPGATPVKVSVWESLAPGSTVTDTIAAWYNRATKPTTPAERSACSNYSDDSCSTAPCSATGDFPGFTDDGVDARVTIPANGFVLVYTAAYSSTKTGMYKLNARTDTL
jgi:hypothetical protein